MYPESEDVPFCFAYKFPCHLPWFLYEIISEIIMEVDITKHLTFSKLHKAIVIFENIGNDGLSAFSLIFVMMTRQICVFLSTLFRVQMRLFNIRVVNSSVLIQDKCLKYVFSLLELYSRTNQMIRTSRLFWLW